MNTTRFLYSAPRRHQAGFSIVELIVGMLIALIATVVVMQVFTSAESFKRTTGAGADAQSNGATALYMIEREIRMSGYGLNNPALLACGGINLFDQVTGAGRVLRVAPLALNPIDVPAADANSDIIEVAYSTSETVPIGVKASSPSASSANFKVAANRTIFRNGDLVVSVQPLATGGPECVLHEITSIPGTAGGCGDTAPQGQSEVVIHNTGQYSNSYKGCNNVSPRYNKAGGIMTTKLDDTNGGMLFNFGPLPVQRIFAVRNQRLTVCNRLEADCADVANFIPIVDDIVSIKAVWGFDTSAPADGTLDVWNRANPTTPAETRALLASRIAVVARSGLLEKAREGAATCDMAKNKATFDGGLSWLGQSLPAVGVQPSGAIDVSSTGSNWACYRYKLFQTTVPIRNNIWRPT